MAHHIGAFRVIFIMSIIPKTPALIFTDLDGSLLDHYSYSFEPAKRILGDLELANIPVVPATSKTFAEVEHLRIKLNQVEPELNQIESKLNPIP